MRWKRGARLKGALREVGRRWGYREVCTPEFEDLELFTMRSGEGIIEEMYVFEDKGGRKLALRPEITAAVIRMYINEAKVAPKPLRWCYFADCFRYERPQKGRYRQFWQFGVELIGADTAMADAEVIMLAADMLDATGVRYELKVGHLALMKNLLDGSRTCRPAEGPGTPGQAGLRRPERDPCCNGEAGSRRFPDIPGRVPHPDRRHSQLPVRFPGRSGSSRRLPPWMPTA